MIHVVNVNHKPDARSITWDETRCPGHASNEQVPLARHRFSEYHVEPAKPWSLAWFLHQRAILSSGRQAE